MECSAFRPSYSERARETLDQINYSARKYKHPLIFAGIGITGVITMTIALALGFSNNKISRAQIGALILSGGVIGELGFATAIGLISLNIEQRRIDVEREESRHFSPYQST